VKDFEIRLKENFVKKLSVSLKILISQESWIEDFNVDDGVKSTLDYIGKNNNVELFFSSYKEGNDKIRLSLIINSENENDRIFAALDFFIYLLGNVRIFEKETSFSYA